jgi:hypothetical protein
MEFRILGPLEVADRDSVSPLGSGKQRGLLSVLSLSANEAVSSDRLIDEWWGASSRLSHGLMAFAAVGWICCVRGMMVLLLLWLS